MKPTQPQNGRPDRLRTFLQGFALVAMVLLVYFPALRGAFIWDDDVNVTDNQTLRSLHGLGQIWFKPGATQQYYPLTHTSFWLDYHLWGLNPLPYHLENILLHAISAVLLWRILKRLTVPGAWLGAALFAVHPVCVESVAWITQRKNTLCAIFFLASIIAGLRFWLPAAAVPERANKSRTQTASVPAFGPWKFYQLALVLYVCSLWGKTATVGLPVVIILLLWWKRRRVGKKEIALLSPFFAVGLAISLITIFVEGKLSATQSHFQIPTLVERCLIAGRAVWFYLGKLVCPYPLVFMYPRWDIGASQPLAYVPLLAGVIVLFFLWRKRDGWGRPVLFVIGYFLVLLFPVIGLLQQSYFAYSPVADHFQYFACIGPLALAAAGLAKIGELLQRRKMTLAPATCALVIALGALTWMQTRIYQNLETLWRGVLAHDPNSWGAHYNLGLVLVSQGKIDDAIQEYTEALQANPYYAAIHDNLGNALAREGKFDGAIEQYNQALQIEPDYVNARNNLGNALTQKGEFDEAIRQYKLALENEPGFADAHYNLANALMRKGKVDDAIGQYNRALQIKPDYAVAHNKLANVLAMKGDQTGALEQYRLALKFEPDLIFARFNLGNLLAAKGDMDGAIAEYESILKSKPDFAEVQDALGNALVAKGRFSEAAEHYRIALQINPSQPEIFYSYGMTLLRLGRPVEARDQFAAALRLKPDYGAAAEQLRQLSGPAGGPISK